MKGPKEQKMPLLKSILQTLTEFVAQKILGFVRGVSVLMQLSLSIPNNCVFCSGTPDWAKGKSAQKSPFLLCTMLDAAVLLRFRGKTGRFQES